MVGWLTVHTSEPEVTSFKIKIQNKTMWKLYFAAFRFLFPYIVSGIVILISVRTAYNDYMQMKEIKPIHISYFLPYPEDDYPGGLRAWLDEHPTHSYCTPCGC